MTNCPTCGRPVDSIFDHLDENCEDWPQHLTLPAGYWPERASFPAKTLFFFDFDGVLIEQSEEKLYQLEETAEERPALERMAAKLGIDPKLYDTPYLRHLVFQATYEGPSTPTVMTDFARSLADPYFIITARSGRHAIERVLQFVGDNDLQPQEIFCLGKTCKGDHLRHMLATFPDYHIVFFDDLMKHIQSAVEVGDPRLIPIHIEWESCWEEAKRLHRDLLKSDPRAFRRLYMNEFPIGDIADDLGWAPRRDS